MEDDVRRERNDQPAGDQGEAAYRGFLFADLRGYTAFVERHGDAAAADLLDAYRELVRSEVARHAGAEIRTEGDSFYVVFGSARRAVACGLAIVSAADDASRDHPERSIKVGIGINAGETVQRGEGYVGRAVNLAARVCAQAREGEVLVTTAVRDAVGAGAGLRFAARGSRRLNGIARPVPLFAVEQGTAPADRVLLPGLRIIPWLPVTIVAVATVLTLAAIAALSGWPGARPPAGADVSSEASTVAPSSSPTPSPSPSVDPADYPNAAEEALLAIVGPAIADHCVRAGDEERPIWQNSPREAEEINAPLREQVPVDAGLRCRVPSIEAPDTVYFWEAQGGNEFAADVMPEAIIHNRAGAESISRGDCSSTDVALGEWQVGQLGGWLLCRELYGDAIIWWSYDGSSVLGVALRRDGDLGALVDWWREEARLLDP